MLIDLFVEDAAHEELLKGLVLRIAKDEEIFLHVRVRSASGGHPRALAEFRLFQKVTSAAPAVRPADLVVVAIDANCSPFATARSRILDAVQAGFRDRVVTACPDPHIERWYLADLESFNAVVGRGPETVEAKCARSHYKGILASAVRQAGHPISDGVDFAAPLAQRMDLYRAERSDPSFKAFLDDFRAAIRRYATSNGHR